MVSMVCMVAMLWLAMCSSWLFHYQLTSSQLAGTVDTSLVTLKEKLVAILQNKPLVASLMIWPKLLCLFLGSRLASKRSFDHIRGDNFSLNSTWFS